MSFDKWRTLGLEELANVKGGKRLPKGENLIGTPNNHPYIRVSDMGNRIIDKSKLLYVPDETFKSIQRYIVNDGDIILSIVGTIGLVSQITDDLENANLTENCVKITDFKGVTQKYLYYYLISETCQNEIKSKTVGTTQPKLPLYNINSLQIRIPPITTQHRITDILSALDEKIELNRQTNATLEAIAQAIFKEWFVDFRFPGTTGEMVESGLGMMPKGWSVKHLPDVIEVNPLRSLKKGEVAPYLDMSNMPTQGHRGVEWVNRPYNSGTRFVNGDTLLARITPCLENGKTAFVDFLDEGQTGWGSTEYIVLHPKTPLPPEYVYYLARSDDLRNFAIRNMIGTSGRQRTPASSLDSFLIVIPVDDIAKQFGIIASSIISQIRANDEESRTISTLRDVLLPKLMNGEIEV